MTGLSVGEYLRKHASVYEKQSSMYCAGKFSSGVHERIRRPWLPRPVPIKQFSKCGARQILDILRQASAADVESENDKKEKEDCGFDKYYANQEQSDNTNSIMSASNI